MKHTNLILIATVATQLVLAGTAAAAMPTFGTVVEGHSMPGVYLGMTQAEVTEAWGFPPSCHPSMDWCRWTRGELGNATVYFPGGRVESIEYRGMPEWVTTAGISTRLAIKDPHAVVIAYPGAIVKLDVTSWTFSIGSTRLVHGVVHDARLGIAFYFGEDPNTGEQTVRVEIMKPSGQPARIKRVRLDEAFLRLTRSDVAHASVALTDEEGSPITNATVYATWTLPGGEDVTVTGSTNTHGLARFLMSASTTGEYLFAVKHVTADDYFFDRGSDIPVLRVHMSR